MGDWNLTIRGTGCHHNGPNWPQDADRMLSRFVRELQEAGHYVKSATITYGAEQDVLTNPSAEDMTRPVRTETVG